MNGWMLLLILAALFVAQSWMINRFAFRGLVYERRFSRLSAVEGETVQMIEEIVKNFPIELLGFQN